MGPRARYLGPNLPAEVLICRIQFPAVRVSVLNITDLKASILSSGLTVSGGFQLHGHQHQLTHGS
jgi:catalase-peroxidase